MAFEQVNENELMPQASTGQTFSEEGPDLYKQAFARYQKFAKPGPYFTPLDPADEQKFRGWLKSSGNPSKFDPDAKITDYDMRGYWKDVASKGRNETGINAADKTLHFTDTYKTPYDTTFSGESRYALPNSPLKWSGQDADQKLVNTETGEVMFQPKAKKGRFEPVAESELVQAGPPEPSGPPDPLLQPRKNLWQTVTKGAMPRSQAEVDRARNVDSSMRTEMQLEGEESAHPIFNVPAEVGGEKTEEYLKPKIGEEPARLAGAAVSGALTPLPGVGTAARVAYGVGSTAAADIAGHFTDNPVIKLGVALGVPLMAGKLLDRAWGSELFERAQGSPPKVGPEASAKAQEPPPAPEPDEVPQTAGAPAIKAPEPVPVPESELAQPAPAQEEPEQEHVIRSGGHAVKAEGLTKGARNKIEKFDNYDDAIDALYKARERPDYNGSSIFSNIKGEGAEFSVKTYYGAVPGMVEERSRPRIDPATADLMGAQATNPQGEVKYLKVGDLRKNPDLLKVAPEEYQFKGGVNDRGVTERERIDKYNPDLARAPLTVHHRPDGDFVVDGHHRLDGALNSASDDTVIPYQVLNGTNSEVPGAIAWRDVQGNVKTSGVTVADARAYGALHNMAEQRGTAFDMAKFMRDTQTSPEEIASLGVRMSEAKTSDATGLAKLSPFLWQEYVRGNLPEARAVEIGTGFADNFHAQEDIYKQIAGNSRYSAQDVQNLIRLRKGSQTVEVSGTGAQMGFGGGNTGGDWLGSTTFGQQAKILSNVQEDLGAGARKMGGAAGAKALLESAGETQIDEEELARKAKEARQINDLLPKFVYQEGTNSNLVLRKLGYELAEQPRNRAGIYQKARAEIIDAVRADAEKAGLKIDDVPDKGPGALDPQKSMFSGGTTLAAGIPPKAVEKAQNLAKWVSGKLDSSNAVSWLKKIFSPEISDYSGSHSAPRTASAMEEKMAELRAHVGSEAHVAAPLTKWFENIPENERAQIYARMQHGDLDMLPDEIRPIARAMYEAADERWQHMNRLKGGELGYIDNYLGQMWANSPDEVKDAYQKLNQATGKPLKGPQGFLKHRKYDDIVAGIEAGLTPKFKNPIEMALKNAENQWRYITGQELMEGLKEMPGGAVFLREGERLPKGMAYIDDKIAKARQHVEGVGMVPRGSWIMPEEGARIVNNFTQPGYQQGWFRSLSAWGNMLRAEFSAFHTLLTANSAADIEAGGALAQAFGKLSDGDILGALKQGAKIPKTWIPVRSGYNVWKDGSELISKALGGQLDDPAVRDVIMGGGTFDFGDSITSKAMSDAFADKLGLPGRVVKNMLGFTMKKIVAPAKLGAFKQLYAKELAEAVEANGGDELTYVQKRQVAQGVRKHIDNVMGQIARDNLHTTQKFKDGLANLIAFPGWNIGSIRLFGGIGRGLYEMGTGGELDQQARLALQYATGKALRMGIYGTILNKLITGEWPKSVYEMMTYPTGKKDSNGNYIRMAGPEYLARDVLSLFGHERREDPNDALKWPKALVEVADSKLNWPLVAGYEILRNADYFGKPIYFSHSESMPKQVAEILGHIAKAGGIPFSYTNIQEQRSQAGEASGPLGTLEGLKDHPLGTLKEIGVGAVGLTPASRGLRQTPMQNYVDMIEQQQVRQQTQNPQQLQKEEAKRELRTAVRNYRSGEDKAPLDLKKYVQQGLSPQEIKEAVTQARLKPLEAAMHRIPLDELGRAWEIAHDAGDDKDADLAKRVTIKRFQSLTDPQKRKELVPVLRKMLAPKKEESRPVA